MEGEVTIAISYSYFGGCFLSFFYAKLLFNQNSFDLFDLSVLVMDVLKLAFDQSVSCGLTQQWWPWSRMSLKQTTATRRTLAGSHVYNLRPWTAP